jgi:hypothetical protein
MVSFGSISAEVHVEAVGEGDGRAVLDVGFDVVLVQMSACSSSGVAIIIRSAQPAAFGHGHHLEAVGLGLLGRGRTFAQRDGDFLHAGILQVQRMRTALRTIADDGTFLPLIRLRSASRS